jgi:prophage DNA circulation protein
MMAWQRASFRGVEFATQIAETTVGQRRAVYEFPFDGKGAASFDLGRRARRYQVDAILYPTTDTNTGVVTVTSAADRLLEALEAPGPGLFVHPTLGPIMVVISSEIAITESHEDTLDGVPILRFRFTATESRERNAVPAATVDARSAVYSRATDVRLAAKVAMVEGTRLQGVQDFIRSAHLTVLDNVISDLALLNGTIGAALAIPAVFASQIDSIANQLVTLIDTPDVLFDALDGAITTVILAVNKVQDAGENVFASDSTAPDSVSAALATLALTITRAGSIGADSLSNEGAATGRAAAPANVDEASNRNVTLRGMRASALSAACEAAVDAAYTSHQEAQAVLASLTTQINRLAERPMDGQQCPDQLFEALQDLRAALAEGINALELVDLVAYTPGETSDAAVIAYVLYGDADRADEVAARSHAPHPGFIPGARTFRVLEK